MRRGLMLCCAVGCCSVLTACAGVRPQTLSIEYRRLTLTPAEFDTRKASLESGTPVSDYLASSPCRFRASFAEGTTSPRTEINGDLGEGGFNIWFSATNAVDAEPDDDASCGVVNRFDLVVGGSNSALAVGAETDKTHFNITIDNISYATDFVWFRATLDSFDPAARYGGGAFRFFGKGPGDAHIIGEGAYLID